MKVTVVYDLPDHFVAKYCKDECGLYIFDEDKEYTFIPLWDAKAFITYGE